MTTPKLDLHTHTVVSGHAFSTLQEMAAAAADKGLEWLGITEHGPALPGSCHPIYFRNLHVVPREINGIKLILGAELNILDYDGTLDLDDDYIRHMDIVIAGLHSLCYRAGTVAQNTSAILGAMHNPKVNIISHPVDGTGEVDIEALVDEARDTSTLLEANNSSLNPARYKTVAGPNTLRLLTLCRDKEVPVILGSDAHISFSIADYTHLAPVICEANFPEELIVNYHPELFTSFTGVTLP